jgi:hypothetical protein
MRQLALVTGVVTLMAMGSGALIRLLIPATSVAAPGQAAQISTDELQWQLDVGPLPVPKIEDVFEAADR